VRNSSLTPPTATRGAGGATSAPRLPSDAPARVVKIEERASGIEVVYSNGIKEEIENGRYEQKNAAGRTVVERPAEAADFARLRGNVRNSGLTLPTPARGAGSSASGFAPRLPPDAQARRIEISGGNIEVRYTQGWREEIEFGRYELKDPNNNTVIERPATQTDRDRLLALTGR
jgi:hypothetical protein